MLLHTWYLSLRRHLVMTDIIMSRACFYCQLDFIYLADTQLDKMTCKLTYIQNNVYCKCEYSTCKLHHSKALIENFARHVVKLSFYFYLFLLMALNSSCGCQACESTELSTEHHCRLISNYFRFNEIRTLSRPGWLNAYQDSILLYIGHTSR